MKKEFPMVAKTLTGLEDVLAKELEQLGASNIIPSNRAILFSGDQRLLYKANLRLRSALKILVPIKEFEARNEHDLYFEIKKINWSKYIDVNDTFVIDSTVFSKEFTHSKYVALKAKDAIVDRFREREGKRPSIDLENPTLRVNIHINQNSVTVSLDSSGNPLNMRGYRMGNHPATINEVLAAGLILLTGWDKKTPLIDPFCGSGTFIIEAAMMAQNVAPNMNRKDFAFKHWKDFDKALWVDVRMEAIEEQEENYPKLIGMDISERAVENAKLNFDRAGVESKNISFSQQDFATYDPPKGPGMLITNPPYGQRLSPDDIQDLYVTIGNRLKNHFQGYHAWVISIKEAFKHLGLHPTPKYTVKNANIECKFQHYEIYEGSKKEAQTEA
ncbi:MAG: RNA methyltransferase [Crocinitomicaceae bacterium]|nr:RNA methyltransferase [Crocinitomicaceae bacterium]